MKKITAIILFCILMTVGCGNSDSTGNKALDGELNLESNQSLVIAQVTAIYGNEITLALAEKVDNSTKGDISNEDSTPKESSSDDKTDKKAQTQVTRYTLTGEEMTATIPVGTPVTTLLGTVTTFSRIAVDNTLQIVTETNKDGEEIIVAIYIVG